MSLRGAWPPSFSRGCWHNNMGDTHGAPHRQATADKWWPGRREPGKVAEKEMRYARLHYNP